MEEFKKYIVDSKNDDKTTKHSFYVVSEDKIQLAETKLALKLPSELRRFYTLVGYGFFFNIEKNHFNRLLSPLQVAQINLREDFYEFDPDLEIYDETDKLIFFEVNEGIFLTISKETISGKNAVYYFDKQISSSLEKFLKEYDENPNFLDEFDI